MAEYSVHVRFDDDCSHTQAEELLRGQAGSYDAVGLETVAVDTDDTDGFVPDMALDIADTDALANVYDELRDREEVVDIALWGPTSDRFPIPIYHYALQQISDPDLYQFHAVDTKVTLIIAESKLELDQVRSDVGPANLA